MLFHPFCKDVEGVIFSIIQFIIYESNGKYKTNFSFAGKSVEEKVKFLLKIFFLSSTIETKENVTAKRKMAAQREGGEDGCG